MDIGLIDYRRCSNQKNLIRIVCFVLKFGKIAGKQKLINKFGTDDCLISDDRNVLNLILFV